jgi:hypothetical protein
MTSPSRSFAHYCTYSANNNLFRDYADLDHLDPRFRARPHALAALEIRRFRFGDADPPTKTAD